MTEPDSATDLIVGLTAGTGGRAQIRSVAQSDSTSSELSFNLMSGSSTSERARIDSSGNLLVGRTSVGSTGNGHSIRGGDSAIFSRDGSEAIIVNRDTSNGKLIEFRKGGTEFANIQVLNGDNLAIIGSKSNHAGIQFGTHSIVPMEAGADSDGDIDLGSSSARFEDIFATNGTIQTSDRNEKQDIEDLSDAEKRVAVAAKGLMKKYRWKSAVAEKGDDARIHVGIMAQDLQEAFTAEGLDASRYAMWCSDTWTDVDVYEQTRLGVRYNELLAFVIAAI